MTDLFGNEHPDPIGNSAKPIVLDLFAHAAERAAIASGRPLSQELLITLNRDTITDERT